MTGRITILDTGTILIIAPPADTLAVMTMLGVYDSVHIECKRRVPLEMTAQLGSGIQPGTVVTNVEWLVGDVFLNNAYLSVDTQNNQISVVELSWFLPHELPNGHRA
ncbi:hypothetical protein BDR03DRAFT_987165 [Suillus americanus]|nr:hypothetical protein BDR03DRAFT_987165 [Suillus americanus]